MCALVSALASEGLRWSNWEADPTYLLPLALAGNCHHHGRTVIHHTDLHAGNHSFHMAVGGGEGRSLAGRTVVWALHSSTVREYKECY